MGDSRKTDEVGVVVIAAGGSRKLVALDEEFCAAKGLGSAAILDAFEARDQTLAGLAQADDLEFAFSRFVRKCAVGLEVKRGGSKRLHHHLAAQSMCGTNPAK